MYFSWNSGCKHQHTYKVAVVSASPPDRICLVAETGILWLLVAPFISFEPLWWTSECVVFEFILWYFHRFLDAGKTTFGTGQPVPRDVLWPLSGCPSWDDMPSTRGQAIARCRVIHFKQQVHGETWIDRDRPWIFSILWSTFRVQAVLWNQFGPSAADS